MDLATADANHRAAVEAKYVARDAYMAAKGDAVAAAEEAFLAAFKAEKDALAVWESLAS